MTDALASIHRLRVQGYAMAVPCVKYLGTVPASGVPQSAGEWRHVWIKGTPGGSDAGYSHCVISEKITRKTFSLKQLARILPRWTA